MVQTLMKYGANQCLQNATGFTALHSAAKRGKIDILQILLQEGSCDINVENKKGKTPLALAVEAKQKKAIR